MKSLNVPCRMTMLSVHSVHLVIIDTIIAYQILKSVLTVVVTMQLFPCRVLLKKLFETNGKQTSDRKILPLMLQQQENPHQISITISQPCSKEVVLIISCSV